MHPSAVYYCRTNSVELHTGTPSAIAGMRGAAGGRQAAAAEYIPSMYYVCHARVNAKKKFLDPHSRYSFWARQGGRGNSPDIPFPI